MKTISMLFASVIFLIGSGCNSCCAMTFPNSKLKGSGRIATRTIDLPEFHSIEASRAVRVILTDSTTKRTVIEADDNMIEHVIVEVHNGKLTVGIDPKIRSVEQTGVRVTVPTSGRIHDLEASSAAEITGGNVILKSPTLTVGASSAAKIDIQAETDRFGAEAASASTIAANVKSNFCTIEASSAAKIKMQVQTVELGAEAASASTIAANVKSNSCTVEASSAAKIDIQAETDRFGAEAASASTIVANVKSNSCTVEASSTAKIEMQVQTVEFGAEAASAAKITLSGKAENCQVQLSSASKLQASDFMVTNYNLQTTSGSSAIVNCTGVLRGQASSGSSISYTGECRAESVTSGGGRIHKK